MIIKEIGSREARNKFRDILDDVYSKKNIFLITSNNKKKAAIINLDLLEELLYNNTGYENETK